MQTAQTRLSLAKTTFEREKRLWEQKISAEQDYLQAGQALHEAEVAVVNAQQKLSALGLTSGASAELAFKYAASDSTDNWFTIQTFPQPATDSTLAVWDTPSLTDGDYTLRLRVFLVDGTFQDAIVSDLKLRNDTPAPTQFVPTETALPQFSAATPLSALNQPTSTAIITFPSSTPLPVNPASVTTSSIYSTFGRSACGS